MLKRLGAETGAPGRESSIAVIGLACRLPRAASAEAYWRLLRDGVDAVVEVPPERWDVEASYSPDASRPGTTNSRWGGFLDDVAGFDADFFWIAADEADAMDPQQRLLLEVAWEAIDDAGLPLELIAGRNVGVFMGVTTKDYYTLMPSAACYTGHETTGNTAAIAANRISYFLDLRGPSLAVDTACSSSLVAVHLACQALRSGQADMALAGGVNVMLLPEVSVCHTKAGITSADGRCKAFDAHANGLVRGEGAGVVVLKPLARALADGDRVRGVIRGSAVNQSGLTNGIMAPSLSAQDAVLRAAYADAGVDPRHVAYVEAHGTGTLLGDAIEARALGGVVGGERAHPCLLGSAKSNLGHLEAAAGIAALVKTLLALEERAVPPSLHFTSPNPNVDLRALGLCVPTQLTPLSPNGAGLVAGVSAFGFGGANAHVVVEEAPRGDTPRRLACDAPQAASRAEASHRLELLPVSARSPDALAALLAAYRTRLLDDDADALADVCHTARERRTHHPYRVAVAGRSRSELAEALARRIDAGPRPAPRRRTKLALVLGGRPEPLVSMMPALLAHEPVFRAAVDACWSEARRLGAPDLGEALGAGGSIRDGTRVADAALLAAQLGLAALWRSWGVVPKAVLGAGTGELTAAHLAGYLDLGAVLRAVLHGTPAALGAGTQPCFLASRGGRLAAGASGDAPCSIASTGTAPSAPALRALVGAGHGLLLELGPLVAAAPSAGEPAGGAPALAETLRSECLDAVTASVVPQPGRDPRATLLEALATIYEAGVSVAFASVFPGRGRCVALPAYAWQRRRHWWRAPAATR